MTKRMVTVTYDNTLYDVPLSFSGVPVCGPSDAICGVHASPPDDALQPALKRLSTPMQ